MPQQQQQLLLEGGWLFRQPAWQIKQQQRSAAGTGLCRCFCLPCWGEGAWPLLLPLLLLLQPPGRYRQQQRWRQWGQQGVCHRMRSVQEYLPSPRRQQQQPLPSRL